MSPLDRAFLAETQRIATRAAMVFAARFAIVMIAFVIFSILAH